MPGARGIVAVHGIVLGQRTLVRFLGQPDLLLPLVKGRVAPADGQNVHVRVVLGSLEKGNGAFADVGRVKRRVLWRILGMRRVGVLLEGIERAHDFASLAIGQICRAGARCTCAVARVQAWAGQRQCGCCGQCGRCLDGG